MIEISNLAFSYGSRPVIQGISLRLEEGKIYGLLGENGVGKTTLLTLLCGLKRPGSGSILVDGRAPFDRLPSLLREQFYLPDEVLPLRATPAELVAERSVFWPKFSFIAFEAILREFEVDTTMRMDWMSAGQLKKTWIGFALACGARYYYMDEPTNGLDIPSKAQFRKALMKYVPEDATMVISTHQVRDLENIIDPIIVLDTRDVIAVASIEEISRTLTFDYGSKLHPEALYVEQIPGGVIQVYPNTTGEESKVNIEAFFNAVHAHKDLAKQLFSVK